MTDELISPQAVYDRLVSQANDMRRQRSLGAVHEICRLLTDRSSSDFTYRNIVTLGKDRGLPVPSEKTIVNSTGAHYRELIHAWRAEKTTDVPKPMSADWIDGIADPVIRMSVILLAKELRAHKGKEARKYQQTGGPIVINPYAGQAVVKPILLNRVEIDALKASIDHSKLNLAGLSIGSRGEITDQRGRIIQKPGFRDAIEKILATQTGAT